tara:strand:+ start:705 stop:863 length:159 start_codon:yes stop_codon:yes gene_type:complete
MASHFNNKSNGLMENILYRIKLSIKGNVMFFWQEFLLSIWNEIRRDKSNGLG